MTDEKITIGDRQKARSAAMKRAVKEYFQENPFMTQKDCVKDLGYSASFISRACSELRQEARKARVS